MKIKEKVILLKIFPFVNLGIENSKKNTCISKHFIAASFKPADYWVKLLFHSSLNMPADIG